MRKAKVLDSFSDRLLPRNIRLNEGLRRLGDTPSPPPIKFDPDIKPRPKENNKANNLTPASRKEDPQVQIKKEFRAAMYAEQEMMVINGLINSGDLQEMTWLSDEFRDKLLEIAKLHDKNERLREINRKLVEEIAALRRELGNR